MKNSSHKFGAIYCFAYLKTKKKKLLKRFFFNLYITLPEDNEHCLS